MKQGKSLMNLGEVNLRVECLKLMAEGASVSVALFPVSFLCIQIHR